MENTEKKVLLSIQNLDVVFNKGKKNAFKAVDNVSFDIYKGETLSLVGESGSGKTTIGRAIIRINPCSAGSIYYDGKKISGKLSKAEDKEVIRKIQMIFQDPAASLNERATIEYIISEGLINFHLYKDEKRKNGQGRENNRRGRRFCWSILQGIRMSFQAASASA